ncbi:MAG: hypothetical protein U9Q92_02260 [archaeon]|nr:hypothetical protein [archaeon]
MEDFVKVLVVGLFIFALALVVLGQMPEDQEDKKETIDEGMIYTSEALGDIGHITSRTRTIRLGNFNVGYTLGKDNPFEEDAATIKNGWFAKASKTIRFSGNDADKAVIEFNVDDMNDYGSLCLFLNGDEIYHNITYPRKFALVVEDLEDDNELVISATSSGPKFWAPTTYILKDISVVIERFDDKTKVIAFEIFPYEYSGWGHGTLSYSVDDSEGFADLITLINGKIVYEGRPLPGDIIEKDFTRKDTNLIPGENLITFKTRKGVSYDLENVELTVSYYGSGESNIKVINFDADQWWTILAETANVTGEIRFFVEKVNLDSGITVYFNDKRNHIQHMEEKEWFTMEFTSDDLREKDNELKFSATGSYRIGKLEVNVVAKE